MSALIGLGALGAGIAVILWLLAASLVRPLISGDRFLHQTTVYLTVLSVVGIDLLLIAAIVRVLSAELAAALFGLAMGIQVVAALSAVLFVRQVRAERG